MKWNLDINVEKLYYNMVAVEAHWLYNLPGWKYILTVEARKEIQKARKNSKTIVKEDKIGRNDATHVEAAKNLRSVVESR